VDERIRALAADVESAGILFLCETGLDPGIDHMSAMQCIDRIRNAGGRLRSFLSHCGGLVAPHSDNNPWHYKISWNPRSVVLAGKAGAVYRENNQTVRLSYPEVFSRSGEIDVPGAGKMESYANRDSLDYIALYGLHDIPDFTRTTLRYPGFCRGWEMVIALQLTDEEKKFRTDGLSIREFFRQHLGGTRRGECRTDD